MNTSLSDRTQLLRIARESIMHGIDTGSSMPLDISRLQQSLRVLRATFVTIRKHGELRGCIGVIEPIRELARDINENAFAAALKDPRFTPLSRTEIETVCLDISILSPMQPIECQDESELIRKLEPGIDGVLIDDGFHRATFLPKVWENLPDRGTFVRQLKIKAGLSPEHWDKNIKVFRYYTENFSEQEVA